MQRVIWVWFVVLVVYLFMGSYSLVQANSATDVVALQAPTSTIPAVSPTPSAATPPPTTPSPVATPTALNITLEKTWELKQDRNGNDKVDPGDTITYEITYENESDAPITDVKITDTFDSDTFTVNPGNVRDAGILAGNEITWNIDEVAAAMQKSLSYDATLQRNLAEGTTIINRMPTVSGNRLTPQTTSITVKTLRVIVPSPTATITPTATMTPTVTATPSAESTVDATTPRGAGIFLDNPYIPTLSIGLLALFSMGILTYVSAIARPNLTPEMEHDVEHIKELEHRRLDMVRDGIFLVFIITGVLMLALGGGIKQDGAISVISTIVGYVFGRATSRRE